MVSICTGIYAYGAAGLLDGKHATTHWRHAEDVVQRFPGVRLDYDSLHIRDGRYYSSAGVTAGIDLALALVEEDFGGRVALRVARDLVVYLKRAGGQAQFSEPLQFQMRSLDRFRDLSQWMLGHLNADLSVEALAERVGLGTRHFSREFRATFGLPPAAYVERLRLDEARRRLLGQVRSIESVARAVGFASADSFRRAFERTFGVAPGEFRRRFQMRGDCKLTDVLLHARDRSDCALERRQIHRLDQVSIEPRRQSALAILRQAISRERDEPNGLQFRRAAKLLRQLIAIHPRKADVQQSHLGLKGLRGLERLLDCSESPA